MKAFPMFIRTTDRRVVVVGGGEQAAQKTRLLLKTDAHITIVAPDLEPELDSIVSEGRATHVPTLTQDVFKDAVMVFVGTGCPGLDAAVHALAKAAHCQVNVVDQPDLCDMTTPAIVDRDPIVVAIGSEGTAPVLTREVKTKLESLLPQNLGGLAALAGRLRPSVAARVPRATRRALWAWVFKGSPRAGWVRGQERAAAAEIKEAIAAGAPPEARAQGHISLVGAGPGARDLMTLRAVERLQEADVIFYDRLVDEEVLELARRDADRVFVGKHVGAHAWPQAQINRVIVAEAQKGRNVVRLKSGDPGIFGRASEEIDAAKAAGLSVDIVPGVTAASAAAAAMGKSLTDRASANTLVLATGTGAASDPAPDCTRLSGPGTTTVFYMSVRQADRITAALSAQGLPGTAPIEVAADVEKATQKIVNTTLSDLSRALQDASITGCAVLMVTWPSEGAVRAQTPLSVAS